MRRIRTRMAVPSVATVCSRSAGCPRCFLLGALLALAGHAAAAGASPPPKPARPVNAASLAKTTAADPGIFALRPLSGPAGGGTAASVYGLNFADGSTVSIGDAAATGVSLASATQINATTPALAPGSVNDVVVTVPGSQAVTLKDAWFAQFLDVPPGYLFARPIEKLRRRGITTGCGAGNYCPADSVTRAQMAVFILRGEHGSDYHPPSATGTVFNDVPKTALFADWIEQFAAEGITTGCGGGMYCPNNSVTRGEMAVFLLRARYGSTYNPPAPVGKFLDVTPSTPFAKWIEKLASDAITGGCGGGNYCPTGPSTRGQMAVFLTKTFADSSQHLIAEALAYGDIDYPTSLLYRAYAMFWDRRLPARYEGAGSIGEDPRFFFEVKAVWSELPADSQAALQPFLLRPDEPGSPFGPPPGGSRPSVDIQPDTNCPTSWIGLDTPGGNFRVHLCTSADSAADDAARATIGAIADDLWAKETRAWPLGMGLPISDGTAGGSGNIDIYLLDPNQCSPRGDAGECDAIPGKSLACAVSADPVTTNAKGRQVSSGYILLARNRLNAPGFKSDFAHEFFHVLQFAYNIDVMDSDTDIRIAGAPVLRDSWFVEASATWAEWNWVPETSVAEVHSRFVGNFQHSDASLAESIFDELHPYAAYIWPFFVQQESGGPIPVFKAWNDIQGAFDPQNVTDAVDGQLSFQDHFRDFAVRNVNLDLPGNPLGTTYQQMYASFPPNVSHKLAHLGTVGLGVSPTTRVSVEPLAAQYDEFLLESTVRKIILRFSSLPSDKADVDLVVRVKTQWKRIKVNLGKPVVFCRDKAEEDVDTIIVIISNHDKAEGHSFSSTYKMEPKPSCCGEVADAIAWNGHVEFSYQHTGTADGSEIKADESAKASGHLTLYNQGETYVSFYTNTLTGTATVHDSDTYGSSPPSTFDGTGPPEPDSEMALDVDLQQCTAVFRLQVLVQATAQPGGGTVGVGVGTAIGRGYDLRDLADSLDGSDVFPAHSLAWSFDLSFFEPGAIGSNIFLDPANEDNAGSAGVSWTFTPVYPTPPASALGAAKK